MSDGQMKERERLSPKEVRETAISALKNAGVQTTGNEEVENLVNRFVENYANNPREEVRNAAESLAEKWRSEEVTELEQLTITGKPAAEKEDLWEQAIARREAGEQPPSAEELSPEQRRLVREAKAEARREAEEDMEEYGTREERKKPDIALAQAEIEAKKEERERYAKWLENHPEVTPGREALYAFRAEQKGGRAEEIGERAAPETELAKAEEQEREPTRTEELAELARERWRPEKKEIAGVEEVYPKEKQEPVKVVKKKEEPAPRPEEEIRPEPVAPEEKPAEVAAGPKEGEAEAEEPIKPEPVEEEPEVAKAERPTARDILKGIDFGTENLEEFNAKKRRAELEEQQRKEAERKKEPGEPKGLVGGERGEEVAEVKPSTPGGETEAEKRLIDQMSGKGPEVELGPLKGEVEEGEEVAPKIGPVAVLKLSPAQMDVLNYGSPGEKRELRAQLMDRKRRTEKMVETAIARGEKTEPLKNEIAAIDDLLEDKRLSGA
ncbi:hypothetical protein GF415_00320 [Candidatus Micrarchaeota archaeon]|nr:hypothetical protein [Candidatus Micrarchaeota archaeon]